MTNKFPIEKLLYEEEGTTLDFKKEEYKFINAEDYEKSVRRQNNLDRWLPELRDISVHQV